MFCCTLPNHIGQIVASICQQTQCISSSNQMCCNECLRQNHSSHSTVSMKKILPQLLTANNQRKFYIKLLDQLVLYLEQEFNNDQFYKAIIANKKINNLNVIEVIMLLLSDLKKRNKQQNKKIKQIQKTLKINQIERNSSPGKFLQPNYQSVIIKPGQQFGRQSRNYDSIPLFTSQISSIQTFSHTLKHPYITLSSDMKSAIKSSQAGGYKLAALSAGPIPQQAQNIFFNIKITKSSGNILLGLGIPQIIKQKQYLNCYGSGQGAFLLGQNGNDPVNSILFHNSDNVYNRKQIVGWNYKQGQILGIGLIKQEDTDLVSFRKYHINSNGKPDYKKIHKQFTMPLWPHGVKKSRLHLMAVLQNINDQVQIIPRQQ